MGRKYTKRNRSMNRSRTMNRIRSTKRNRSTKSKRYMNRSRSTKSNRYMNRIRSTKSNRYMKRKNTTRGGGSQFEHFQFEHLQISYSNSSRVVFTPIPTTVYTLSINTLSINTLSINTLTNTYNIDKTWKQLRNFVGDLVRQFNYIIHHDPCHKKVTDNHEKSSVVLIKTLKNPGVLRHMWQHSHSAENTPMPKVNNSHDPCGIMSGVPDDYENSWLMGNGRSQKLFHFLNITNTAKNEAELTLFIDLFNNWLNTGGYVNLRNRATLATQNKKWSKPSIIGRAFKNVEAILTEFFET